jgi:hypothetical protein
MPKNLNKEKTKYKITNWADYNKSLINRGSITFWFSEDVIAKWRSSKQTGKKGHPEIYSDDAILCALVIREVFRLPLRALQGFLFSLIMMLRLDLHVPSYSQISRRSACLNKKLNKFFKKGAAHIVFDSSGLKVYGEGEWKRRQYGKSKRRTWRKIHIGINPENGEILLCEMTKNSTSDAKAASDLLDKVKGKLKRITGDGAFDRWSFREKVARIGAKAVIPPKRNAVYRGDADGWRRERDLDIAVIKVLGGDDDARKLWKKLVGYHERSLVETTFSRIKRILGSNLKARKFENQRTECQVKCLIMNKMIKLGMPISEPVFEMAA